MLGLVLAIALLIVVLSVMNGFDREMRERILSLVPHITLYSHRPMTEWEALQERVAAHPAVHSVAPFTQFDALFMRGTDIETARGIGMAVDDRATELMLASLTPTQRAVYEQRPDSLLLGVGIARRLGVSAGDTLTLIVPGGGLTGDTGATRLEALYLAGVVETGTELDQGVALLHLATASRLAGLGDAVSGLRVSTLDLFAVGSTAKVRFENGPSAATARRLSSANSARSWRELAAREVRLARLETA